MTELMLPILILDKSVILPTATRELPMGKPTSLAMAEFLMELDAEEGIYILTGKAGPDGLEEYGTLARVVRLSKVNDVRYNISLRGVERVRILGYPPEGVDTLHGVPVNNNFKVALYEAAPWETNAAIVQPANELLRLYREYHSECPDTGILPPANVSTPAEALEVTLELLRSLTIKEADKLQGFLSSKTTHRLIHDVHQEIGTRLGKFRVERMVDQDVSRTSRKANEEALLQAQRDAINKRLGKDASDLDVMEMRVKEAGMSEEATKEALKQIQRMRTMQPSSAEFNVARSYIDVLLELPWSEHTEDNLNLAEARYVLESDHYGLEQVKSRIIEYLAVRKLKGEGMRGPILCLAGPPGTGKTSICRSIAKTLGRSFVRISLGGVHDEAEIRGHRRTYVGAMPGKVIKAFMKAGSANPLIVLDEIDKVGADHRGDPQAALLEVLDPEQNNAFTDHYLDLPFDLSDALFIATANQLNTISAPLRDRMEIIEVPSYTIYEKEQIATRYLLPEQLEAHGLSEDAMRVPDDVLRFMIESYTREAGVRNLKRRLGGVCRNVAVEVAATLENGDKPTTLEVTKQRVEDALGPVRHINDIARRSATPGVVTGLAWTPVGGDILFIEARLMPGSGKLIMTGQLGDVMKESVTAALSFIKSEQEALNVVEAVKSLREQDLHLHVPAGAIPKDGPSAGVTMFSAILSLLRNTPVKPMLAMTGEITLSGDVIAVGGIREKVIAAHRAGIKEVVMPSICKKDLVEVQEEVRDDLKFHFVDRITDLLDIVFVPNGRF